MAPLSINLCAFVIICNIYFINALPLAVLQTNSTTTSDDEKGFRISALKAQEACDSYPTRKDLQQLTDLILNGIQANEGDFPFIAALGYPENNSYGFYCGGSLISDSFILTAGHCLETSDEREPAIVRLGSTSLKQIEQSTHIQDIKVKRIIKHPNFNPSKSRYNDIALIELEKPIERTKFVSPVCLSTQLKDDQTAQSIMAEGYGETMFSGISEEQMLLHLKLFPVDSKICYSFYKNDPKLNKGIKTDSMICASDAEKVETFGSVCQGDAGSPLQTVVDDKFYLLGISSLGTGFCRCSKIPSIFTRAAFYLDWIASIVWP